jgi:sec-independent protein translocase protein TatC
MRLRIGSTLIYPLVGFAICFTILLAIPVRLGGAFAASGAYTPLVALFLSEAKAELLPQGWVLIGFNATSALEVYLATAAQLAFVFDYPIVAFVLVRPIVLAKEERRGLVTNGLTIFASLLFAIGAVYGYFFFFHYILISSVPYYYATGMEPVINAPDFYYLVFKTVMTIGLTFSIPAYAYAIIAQARAGYVRSVAAAHDAPHTPSP